MTLKLVDKETTPPTSGGSDEINYRTYKIRYKDAVAPDRAYETEKEGYPILMGGFFSIMKLDEDKQSYAELMVPSELICSVELVK